MSRKGQNGLQRALVAAALIGAGFSLSFAPTVLGIFGAWLAANDADIAAGAALAQTVIVLVSVIVAYVAYTASKKTAAQQNTLDRIFQEHIDQDVLKHRRMFLRLRDDPHDKLSNYASSDQISQFLERQKSNGRALSAEETEKLRELFALRQAAIFAVLNRYETFALGIDTGAIDEEMYKRWWRASLIRDWHALKEIVGEIRKTGRRSFVEFEALARKWEDDEQTH